MRCQIETFLGFGNNKKKMIKVRRMPIPPVARQFSSCSGGGGSQLLASLEESHLANKSGSSVAGDGASRLERLRETLKLEKQGGLPRKANQLPKPSWMKIPATSHPDNVANYIRLKETVKGLKLATVCESAKCPNIGECWGGGEIKRRLRQL